LIGVATTPVVIESEKAKPNQASPQASILHHHGESRSIKKKKKAVQHGCGGPQNIGNTTAKTTTESWSHCQSFETE